MKTRIFSFLVAFLATLQLFAVNDYTVDGIGYVKLGGDSVEVGENKNVYGDVVIPATIKLGAVTTYRVVGIGYAAFNGCSSLTAVTIPSSVTSIGVDAFSGCDKLDIREYDNGYYLGNKDNPYIAFIDAKYWIESCLINNDCILSL